MPQKTGWKIYAWVLAIGFAAGLLAIPTNHSILNLVALPINLAVTIGVFGYAYHKRIARQYFWQIVFFLEILYVFIFLFFIVPSRTGHASLTVRIILSCFILLIDIPAVIALYKYAFPRKIIKKGN